jgi:hypothetical protein
VFANFVDHPQIVFGIGLLLFNEREVLSLLIQPDREKQQIPNSTKVSLKRLLAAVGGPHLTAPRRSSWAPWENVLNGVRGAESPDSHSFVFVYGRAGTKFLGEIFLV